MQEITLNGFEIERESLEIEGIDMNDYPKFCDAFFSSAKYTNGAELTDNELDELSLKYSGLINEMLHELIF